MLLADAQNGGAFEIVRPFRDPIKAIFLSRDSDLRIKFSIPRNKLCLLKLGKATQNLTVNGVRLRATIHVLEVTEDGAVQLQMEQRS
jgi:hypothetical protein